MTQVTEPFPIFYDDDGTPLENGMIYIGQANQDPRTNPVTVYRDEARTVPIAQPIRTLDGRPAFQGAPVNLYVNEPSYSISVQNRFGSPVTSATDIGLSAQDVSFLPAGTGAALRTVEAKLDEFVSPEDFSGTDTAKFNAALATGKPVRCGAQSYAITGTLTPTAAGQIVDLNGALLTCTGNFDVFNVTGLQGVTIRNGRIEAAAMTGGDVLNIVNAERTTFENVLVFNPFNFAFVQKANVAEIRNVWVNNIRGAYGIRWLGDASNRSDVLRLIGVVMSFPDTGIGIDWDGNCHTLQTFGVIIVRPNKGVRISNTAGATGPEFGFFTNLEIDFPQSYGVEILAGESYYFGPQFYCQGSVTRSGVFVASGLAADRIQFAGGKIAGNATYGIENNVRVLVSNLVLTGNATANYLNSDTAILTAPRVEIDSTFLMRVAAGDPLLQFDANDYIGYSRSANDMIVVLGGATTATFATNRVQFTQPPQLPVTTVAGLPAAAAGNRGREYYVSDANATTRFAIVAGGGANFVKVFSNGTNWLIA